MSRLSRSITAAVLAGLMISSAAYAATSGTLEISGTVATTLSITVAGLTTATTTANLDLSQATDRIVKVADLSMTTNNSAGLTLSITTANTFALQNGQTGNPTPIAYTAVTVNDNAAAPAAGAFPGSGFTPLNTGSAGTAVKDLYIKYSPAAVQDPGTYSDTLTLTVADN